MKGKKRYIRGSDNYKKLRKAAIERAEHVKREERRRTAYAKKRRTLELELAEKRDVEGIEQALSLDWADEELLLTPIPKEVRDTPKSICDDKEEAVRYEEGTGLDEIGYESLRLSVLEPSDLDPLSLSDVKIIWRERLELCGSLEVAAEALAILEVSSGLVDSYLGWQHYVNHESLEEWKSRHQAVDVTKSPLSPVGADRDEVMAMSQDELKSAWSRRSVSFKTVSAACTALARLRFTAGVDSSMRGWEAFIDHDEIVKIDELEDDTEVHVTSSPSSLQELREAQITRDNRQKRLAVATVRSGQSEFRKQVLAHYKERCCISGCGETAVLEAAHISPHSGPASDRVENALCLRVDIHRLFDKMLLAVNPDSLSVEVASSIKDPYYRALAGNQVLDQRDPLFRLMLRRHYESFVKFSK